MPSIMWHSMAFVFCRSETRKRDIRDSDVKSLISSEESYKRGSFNCRRSANGKLFIDSGTWCEAGSLASIFELFAELEA